MLKILCVGKIYIKDMKYVLLRSIQIVCMVIIISGLIWGIRDNNVMLELNALIIGAGIFYISNMLLKKD